MLLQCMDGWGRKGSEPLWWESYGDQVRLVWRGWGWGCRWVKMRAQRSRCAYAHVSLTAAPASAGSFARALRMREHYSTAGKFVLVRVVIESLN